MEFGQSIQAAVDQARPGDRVKVRPGTYREPGRACPTSPTRICAVVISTDNITLEAEPLPGKPVILENSGIQFEGIAVAKQGTSSAACANDPSQHVRGIRIAGFRVRNFASTGIFLLCADNWIVRCGHENGGRAAGRICFVHGSTRSSTSSTRWRSWRAQSTGGFLERSSARSTRTARASRHYRHG